MSILKSHAIFDDFCNLFIEYVLAKLNSSWKQFVFQGISECFMKDSGWKHVKQMEYVMSSFHSDTPSLFTTICLI